MNITDPNNREEFPNQRGAPWGCVVSPAELHVLLQLRWNPRRAAIQESADTYEDRDIDMIMARFAHEDIAERIPDVQGEFAPERRWRLTKRGEAWMDMLLNTPFPIVKWVRPEEVKL